MKLMGTSATLYPIDFEGTMSSIWETEALALHLRNDRLQHVLVQSEAARQITNARPQQRIRKDVRALGHRGCAQNESDSNVHLSFD
jgi:hypothetical protein